MKPTLVLLSLILAVPLLPATAQEKEATEDVVLARMTEPVVFLRYVLKLQVTMGGQTRDQEQSMEVPGVLVSERGLVMTAHSNFSPSARLPRGMRSGVEIRGTPTDIKVLFGSEEEEYEAQLAAMDSVLGLAYVQILDLGERKPVHVDLSAGAVPTLGADLLAFSRLPRDFDCAPVLGRMYVRGKVEKPREMWVVGGEGGTFGLPVFDTGLRPVGVMVRQSGSSGVDGGGEDRPFLLPLSSVASSLKAAREKGEALLTKPAEEAPEPADPPAEEGKPAEEKPPEEGR